MIIPVRIHQKALMLRMTVGVDLLDLETLIGTLHQLMHGYGVSFSSHVSKINKCRQSHPPRNQPNKRFTVSSPVLYALICSSSVCTQLLIFRISAYFHYFSGEIRTMVQLSVWEKESFFAPADIVIAGSGLAGLWSAYYLKKKSPSLRITIVERGLIPTGASTRNAGFACFGSLTELVADARQMGEDNMLELVEMRYKGIKRIRKTFGNAEIDYEKHGGYELFTASPNLATTAPDPSTQASASPNLATQPPYPQTSATRTSYAPPSISSTAPSRKSPANKKHSDCKTKRSARSDSPAYNT